MATPSKGELALLEVFRQNVMDIVTPEQLLDDMFLIRWLRARDMNLEKAEAMLRNAQKWRVDNNLQDVIPGQHSNIYYPKTFPYWIDAMDKEGKPFVTVPFGKWDVRKVVNSGQSAELIKYFTECFETGSHSIRIADANRLPGSPRITQLSGVLDWTGFSWRQLFSYQCVQNFLQIARIYEGFYPEMLERAYFINCPALISVVMGLLRPVLAPKTLAKIQVFGCDRNEWEPEILKWVDASQIRAQFGGMKPLGPGEGELLGVDKKKKDPFLREYEHNI